MIDLSRVLGSSSKNNELSRNAPESTEELGFSAALGVQVADETLVERMTVEWGEECNLEVAGELPQPLFKQPTGEPATGIISEKTSEVETMSDYQTQSLGGMSTEDVTRKKLKENAEQPVEILPSDLSLVEMVNEQVAFQEKPVANNASTPVAESIADGSDPVELTEVKAVIATDELHVKKMIDTQIKTVKLDHAQTNDNAPLQGAIEKAPITPDQPAAESTEKVDVQNLFRSEMMGEQAAHFSTPVTGMAFKPLKTESEASSRLMTLVNMDDKAAILPASTSSISAPVNTPLVSDMVNEQVMKLEKLTEQFDQRLLSMVQKNEKVTKITIQPATLGKVTVVCREEQSSLTIEIITQSNSVRELLAMQEDSVREIMLKNDVQLNSFDVQLEQKENSARNFAGNRGKHEQNQHGIGPAVQEEAEPQVLQAKNKSGAVSVIA